MREIRIDSGNENQRLDKYLTKYLDLAPKSFIYKMLRKKNIKLNGLKASGSEMLQCDDLINIYISEESIVNFKSDSKLNKVSEDLDYYLDIVYEDDNLILINKPANMLSQKASKEDISINEYMLSYLNKKHNYTDFTPSVLNRLDRNTTGIIIGSVSLLGSQYISYMLKERLLDKRYLTIVKGVISKPKIIDGYLVKDERTNKVSISNRPSKNSQAIITEYDPMAISMINGGFTLLEVKLITGKSHQIRAHLSSINHPVVGDYKYGDKYTNQFFHDKYGLTNHLLHAYKLSFPDNMDKLSYLNNYIAYAKLPREFEKIKEALFN